MKLDLKRYYVGKAWRGKRVNVHLNAPAGTLMLLPEGQVIKEIEIACVSKTPMAFDRYVQQMKEQPRAEHRLRSLQERQERVRALSSR